MNVANSFPTLLEAFFIDRLVRQRQVSPHTLASYRDTFRLLLQYAQRQLGKAPSALALPDLDTPFLGAFLDHLEQERDNSARSRNVRLAAIHSFFRYVALHAPEHSALAQRVLAMPSKRYPRRPIDFLAPAEVAALLAAPNLDTWGGRRDRALAAACRADRSARLRTPRFALPGHRARPQRPCAMPRQRTQGPQHTTTQGDRHSAAQLAPRAPRPVLRTCLSYRLRRGIEP